MQHTRRQNIRKLAADVFAALKLPVPVDLPAALQRRGGTITSAEDAAAFGRNYNDQRPHSAHKNMTPSAFYASVTAEGDRPT